MNHLFTKTILSLAFASLFAFAASTPVEAATATGVTTFKVILQPAVALDYYKEIDLTVNASGLLNGSSANQLATKAITATASGTTLTADAGLVTTGSNLSAINLVLNNVWCNYSVTCWRIKSKFSSYIIINNTRCGRS